MKKVSFVIVNYNDKNRIGRAILSCLNQSWENKEIIVVDDGSIQEVRELYKKYDGIKLIQLERSDKKLRTVSRAFNEGIKASTGDYIAILGSDDYFDTKYAEILIKLNTDIAFCNWRVIGKQNEDILIQNVWDFNQHVLNNYLSFNQLSHECMLCSREVVEKVGLYDERLPRSQDCDWIVRAMLKEFEWQHVEEILVNVEKHEKDQQKNYASVHGKTLWSLKNNVNIRWILNYLKNGEIGGILGYYQGIHDFINNPEWNDDFMGSEFQKCYNQFIEELNNERTE
jgi:glycosyltransferase involved in cell wall biosynthesis